MIILDLYRKCAIKRLQSKYLAIVSCLAKKATTNLGSNIAAGTWSNLSGFRPSSCLGRLIDADRLDC